MDALFQSDSVPRSSSAETNCEDIVDSCYVLTGDALRLTGVASEQEVQKSLLRVREGQAKGEPLDLLETLARIQGHDEERLGSVISEFGDAIASTMNPRPPSVPFCGKLIAPSSFYESYDALHKIAKLLLTPVIYAEDSDAIGTASINPIAAQILGEEIYKGVDKRFGIRPFISIARMEYESWAFLCRKHFEL